MEDRAVKHRHVNHRVILCELRIEIIGWPSPDCQDLARFIIGIPISNVSCCNRRPKLKRNIVVIPIIIRTLPCKTMYGVGGQPLTSEALLLRKLDGWDIQLRTNGRYN